MQQNKMQIANPSFFSPLSLVNLIDFASGLTEAVFQLPLPCCRAALLPCCRQRRSVLGKNLPCTSMESVRSAVASTVLFSQCGRRSNRIQCPSQ